MKYLQFTFSGLIILLSITSCNNYVALSKNALNKYNIDETKIKKIQFFISKNVALQSAEKSPTLRQLDKKGKVIESTEAKFDEVIIYKGTPGLCVKVLDDNFIAVSFDPEDDNKYLVFGNVNRIGRYHLLAEKWASRRGKIRYGDKVYYVSIADANAFIKFKYKKKEKYKRKSSVAKGRTIK